jgi:hypothetical protein
LSIDLRQTGRARKRNAFASRTKKLIRCAGDPGRHMIGTTMDDAPLGLDPIDLPLGLTRDGRRACRGWRWRARSWPMGEERRARRPEPVPATRVHALLLGLRRFETVNLAYGSAAGDGALVEVAGRLTQFAAQELTGAWMVARAPAARSC